MADENKVPHDWRAVGIDVTGYYNIAEEDKAHIEKIVDVFFYDKNEYTYCCELTPSYFLRHLYTTIFYKEPVYEDSYLIDRLDQKYAHEPTDDCYMHVHDVDSMKELTATYNTADKSFPEAEEDEVREYWQGNCPF